MSVFHQNILAGASGAGGAGDPVYVDDVFSTFLLTGNGASSRSVQNGLDLSGEGGLVWFKARDQSYDNALFDTERGANQRLNSNALGASATETDTVNSFDSNGFTLGSNVYVNGSGTKYVSWSFRKAPGFFDVVTYTGNGTAGRTVSHNLGSTPGAIIIKKYSNSENWIVYHRSAGATKFLKLNDTSAASTSSVIFNNTEPTSTVFTLGANSQVNENGDTYVAYVFAHDDQSFGTGSDEAIIKCGSYSGSIGNGGFVDLGFEPQWVIFKRSDSSGEDWEMADVMRGSHVGTSGQRLLANTNGAESTISSSRFEPQPTGFNQNITGSSSATVIYIAIRRPNKPPTAGTDVFVPAAAAGNSDVTANFPVDLAFQLRRSAGSKAALTRLQGKATLEIRNTNAETVNANAWYESNTKFLNAGLFTADSAFHLFKRAPGFMDVVCFTSANTSTQTVSHSLGAVPEFFVVKKRDSTSDWQSYHASLGNTKYVKWNNDSEELTSSARWNNTTPTATQFTLGSEFQNSNDYVALLFATLSGISKVGSYTGTGNNIDVDCGFTAGARFVVIKRSDSNLAGSTGDWYVYDTARGIASGNDPYLFWNETAAEVTNTDYIDPLTSGFTVTSSAPVGLNASGGTYIFLAIA